MIAIQPGEPRSPQIIRGLEDSNVIQLSSPLEHYNRITCLQPTRSPTVVLQHKESDGARLKAAKGAISSLEDRVRAIEEDMKEQENLILEWETCYRLAQGLNDLIKDAIMNPKDEGEDLSNAKVIWGPKNHYRYLPHLFTEWWLAWVDEFPDEQLPLAFNSLSPSDISNFRSRRPLTEEISRAAETLWDSSLHDNIIFMLTCFHKRPQVRNNLQHPWPSTAFACSFVNSYLELSEEQKLIGMSQLESIIDSGKRPDGTFLFDHIITPPAPAPHAIIAMGMTRGTTRQREFADDEGPSMAVKKQKRGD